MTWDRGLPDHPSIGTARGYRLWRALPAAAASRIIGQAAAEGGDASDDPARPRIIQVGEHTVLQRASAYWELAGDQLAVTLPAYARTVTTLQDSTAAGPADEMFMVEAFDDSSHHWFSDTLTGHSVDNLPPGPLSSAAGFYETNATSLFWGGVSDADLCCYQVFRGLTSGFEPDESNLVGTTGEVTFTDAYGSPAYYRIAALDVHGNLGPSSLVSPEDIADTRADTPLVWSLGARWIARAGAIELTLDLPQSDEGRLELFDVVGRRLWSEPFRADAAQRYVVRTAGGVTLPSGVVFARAVSRTGDVLTARVVVLR